jgi:hypothetical protein
MPATAIVVLASLVSGACVRLSPSNVNVDPTPHPSARTNVNRRPAIIPANEDPLIIAELERFASRASVKNLKDKKLKEQDTELRIWVGFGAGTTRGLLLTDQGGTYTGVYIPPSREDSGSVKPRSVAGRGGWVDVWRTLEENGFFDLPDDSVVGTVEPFQDSDVLFVEFKKGSAYRTFSYSAPCYSSTKEAKALLSSLGSVNASLGFSFYDCPESSRQ